MVLAEISAQNLAGEHGLDVVRFSKSSSLIWSNAVSSAGSPDNPAKAGKSPFVLAVANYGNQLSCHGVRPLA